MTSSPAFLARRLRTAALAVILAIGFAVIAPAVAASADDLVIEVQPVSVAALPGAMITFSASSQSAVAVQWQHRGSADAPWADLPTGSGNDLTLFADVFAAGEYRANFTSADDALYASDVAVLTLVSLSWAPAPVFVPEGTTITQSARVIGVPDAEITWQIGDTQAGPWTDLPGATDGELSLPVALDLSGKWLRPLAVVSGTELTVSPGRLRVYPLEPSLPVQADAESLLAGPFNTVAGASVTGDTLTVTLIPGATPFGDQTWYHGTAFPDPVGLGWARASAPGILTFDVSSLPAGDHTLLVRLPFPGNGALTSSGAVRFTVAAAPAPDGAGNPEGELADTASVPAPVLGGGGALLAVGVLLVALGRRRRAVRSS